MRHLYSLFFYIATPLILLHLWWRGRADSRWRERWRERFGRVPSGRCDVLVHCASVGEVNAVAPLVTALLDCHGLSVAVSCFTPTGSARIDELFGGRVAHAYAPLDLPGACARSFAAWRPRLFIVVETEIWPNRFAAAVQTGVPIVLINAQLSERTAARYRSAGGLVRQTLLGVSRILACTEEDASRFERCGARRERLDVVGNLKFDVPIPDDIGADARELRARWGASRPVVAAGSTHAADEAALAAAWSLLLPEHPEALLIVAPRHPERFDEACAALRESGLRVNRLTSEEPFTTEMQCLLLDTLGDLPRFYAASDICFVGGSFSDLGGHNVLEPATLGRPVLTGPDMSGAADVMELLVSAGGGRTCADSASLAENLRALLEEPGLRRTMGEAAADAVRSGRGALTRTESCLMQFLG